MIDEEFSGDLRQDWSPLMQQDEIWIDKAGNKLSLDEMEPRYCGNVYNLMLRSLPGLARADSWSMMASPGPSGDMACDAFDSEIARLEHIAAHPNEYAADAPLMKALLRRIEGLPARPEEPVAQPDTFDRRPQTVRAIQYTGDNLTEVEMWIDNRGFRVEEKMVSGPGPLRGMIKILSVWSVNTSAAVPVDGWLLSEDGEEFWGLEDRAFRKDYQAAIVDAEILCYCGEPRRSDDDPKHGLCFPGMD